MSHEFTADETSTEINVRIELVAVGGTPVADTGRPDATHAVFHLNSTAFTHAARLIDHRAGHCERIHHEAVTGRGVEVVVELVVCRLNYGF